MKKQFSPSECENIMEKFLEFHYAKNISMYQLIKYPHILVVDVVSIMDIEIEEMRKMNLNVTLFAQCYHIQMWLSKN